MANAQLSLVLRQIKMLAGSHATKDLPDGELLQRYCTLRDENAFTIIVRRYGSLVMRTCRHVLHHEQDAEDAFQATFLVLARKASSIRQGGALASWLYGVAFHMAMNAKRGAARRRGHERQARPMAKERTNSELALRELETLLAEEMKRLPEKYRAAFVLCCLEGLSKTEAARRLGWKEGTVSGCLARARKHLQQRLIHRGITVPTLLAAVAVAQGATPVRPVLVDTTIKAALQYAAGKTAAAGLISAKANVLAEGAMRTMLGTKLKVVTAAVFAVGLAATGAGMLRHEVVAEQRQGAAQPGTPKQSAQGNAKAEPANAPGVSPADVSKSKAMDHIKVRGRVLDPDGKPFAGAKLYLNDANVKEKDYAVRATSGDDGRFEFTFAKSKPKQEKSDSSSSVDSGDQHPTWQIIAVAKGYGCGWAVVRQREQELTLRLVKDMPAGGRIIDADGKPVAGAKLRVDGLNPLTGDKRDGFVFVFNAPYSDYAIDPAKGWTGPVPEQSAVLTTATDGRFRLAGVGPDRVVFLHLEGPGIATVDMGLAAGTPADYLTTSSRPIRGIVRDKDTGKPLAGVTVFSGSTWINPRYEEIRWVKAVSNKDGRYELLGLAKSASYDLTVRPARGQLYFQRHLGLQDARGLDPLTADIEMVQGLTVRGKVSDKATGKSVGHARVEYYPLYANPYVNKLGGGFSHPRSEATTGPDGSYILTVLPGQGVLEVTAPDPDAYMPGFVSLKERKNFFKAPIFEFNGDGMVWAIGGNAFDPLETDCHALVLLEPGEKEEGLVKDIVLEPPQERKGKVVGPDSQPISGVTVSGLWPRWYVTETLKGPEFTVHGLNPRSKRGLTFHHKEKKLGFLLKELPDEKLGPLTVKLQQCGSISGRIVDPDGQPIAGESLPGGLSGSLEIVTDKEGRFHVDGLVPGVEYHLMRPRVVATLLVSVVVEPGKNKDLGDLKLDK